MAPNDVKRKLASLLRHGWLQIIGSLLIVVAVSVFAREQASMWTVIAGLLVAALGGSVAGIVVATFLARNPAKKNIPPRASPAGAAEAAREEAEDTRAALSLEDALDALPDIHKDHVKVARLYGVYTVAQLADATTETQDNLKRAFGRALFLRSYAIAVDCKRLSTGDPLPGAR